MKKNMKINSMLMGGLLALGMYGCTPEVQDYSSYVNPFIGTGGHGHTYPGAVVPNGMIPTQPRHTHLSMGRLFRLLLCRLYHQRVFTYASQRYGVRRLR